MVSLLDMYESEVLVDFFLWFLESLALKVLTRQSFLGNFITAILPCCCFLFFFQIIAIFHAVAMNWNILKFYLYYWILKSVIEMHL